jgi:mono/diheme cytochrome c family protein
MTEDNVVHPYGDPESSFWSLAVVNRFEPGLNRDMARGKELYFQYCAICHGESGDGNGFNAYNLKSNFGIQPYDFTDSVANAQIKPDEFKMAIRNGGQAVSKSRYMPPWGGVLSDYDLACVTDYVLRFREPGNSTTGE